MLLTDPEADPKEVPVIGSTGRISLSLLDVQHQTPAHETVQRALRSQRVPHAYIFHGPDGVGKELFATGFAQLLLCEANEERPTAQTTLASLTLPTVRVACESCADCTLVKARSHPDLHLIYRQLNRDHPEPEVRATTARDIAIGVLRHFLIDKVGRTPQRGRGKVFIIREADRMGTPAQNALLKTLEEPPGDTVLILLVDAIDRLLPTVLSRCQTVAFGSLPADFVQAKLVELVPDLGAEDAKWYAGCASQSIGRAIEDITDELHEVNGQLIGHLMDMPANPQPTKWWEDHAKALGNHCKKRDPALTDAEAMRRGCKTMLRLTANWYADLIRLAYDRRESIINEHKIAELDQAAKQVDAELAGQAIERARQAEQQLDTNAYVKLVIETLLNDLAHVGRGEVIAVL